MSAAVKLSEDVIANARVFSKALNRSVSGQIEHWARIGKIAEENPDLTYALIKNVLIAQEESRMGKLTRYEFQDDDE